MTKNKLHKLFPNRIGKKYLFKEYLKIPKARYVFAIYESEDGEEYIAKMASKNNKKMVSELRNEANAYRLLQKAKKKVHEVSIPKLIKTYENDDIFLILEEKINGKQLRELSMRTKTKSLFKVDYYLNDLRIKRNDINNLGKLHSYRFILLFPFLSLISLIKNPKLIRLVVENSLKGFSQSIKVLQTENYGLVHRDLNTANVMYLNKNLYLLDMQLMSFGPRSHDFSNMFYRLWKAGEKSYLAESYRKYIGNSKNIVSEHKFMMTYAALYDLSIGTKRNKDDVRSFMEFIKAL